MMTKKMKWPEAERLMRLVSGLVCTDDRKRRRVCYAPANSKWAVEYLEGSPNYFDSNSWVPPDCTWEVAPGQFIPVGAAQVEELLGTSIKDASRGQPYNESMGTLPLPRQRSSPHESPTNWDEAVECAKKLAAEGDERLLYTGSHQSNTWFFGWRDEKMMCRQRSREWEKPHAHWLRKTDWTITDPPDDDFPLTPPTLSAEEAQEVIEAGGEMLWNDCEFRLRGGNIEWRVTDGVKGWCTDRHYDSGCGLDTDPLRSFTITKPPQPLTRELLTMTLGESVVGCKLLRVDGWSLACGTTEHTPGYPTVQYKPSEAIKVDGNGSYVCITGGLTAAIESVVKNSRELAWLECWKNTGESHVKGTECYRYVYRLPRSVPDRVEKELREHATKIMKNYSLSNWPKLLEPLALKPEYPRICDMPVRHVFVGKYGGVEGVFLKTYLGLVYLNDPRVCWHTTQESRPTEYKPVEMPVFDVHAGGFPNDIKAHFWVKQG